VLFVGTAGNTSKIQLPHTHTHNTHTHTHTQGRFFALDPLHFLSPEQEMDELDSVGAPVRA